MAIHSSNLWTRFRQTKLSALCVSPLHGCQGVYTLDQLGACFTFSVHAKLLLEHMMQAAAEQTSLYPHSLSFLFIFFPLTPLPSAASIISK